MDSAFTLSNVTQIVTPANDVRDKRVIDEYSNTNRSARDARLLKGETMGGLKNCNSFEIGDQAKREFYSPNYPEIYPRNTACTRRIIGEL
ncbi:Neuropilin and tolloid-like protein 2 [Sarracenia purpurea var. burkii]